MNWDSKATRWEWKPSPATGIRETPAGGKASRGGISRPRKASVFQLR